MALLVPFDGSDLSKTALTRAMEFADCRNEEITALSAIPGDATYARDRGWIDADEASGTETVADRMRERAESVAPTASFRYEVPEDVNSMASTTDITRTIRKSLTKRTPQSCSSAVRTPDGCRRRSVASAHRCRKTPSATSISSGIRNAIWRRLRGWTPV